MCVMCSTGTSAERWDFVTGNPLVALLAQNVFEHAHDDALLRVRQVRDSSWFARQSAPWQAVRARCR